MSIFRIGHQANIKLSNFSLAAKPILGHISTFGGHPVSCVASEATIKTLLDEKLIESCEAKGQYLLSQINHSSIIAKRQIGLLIAIEFESFEVLKAIIDKAIQVR